MNRIDELLDTIDLLRARLVVLQKEARVENLRREIMAFGCERTGVIREDDVQWVVNDMGELGVKINNQLFFCYKGASITYGKYRGDDKQDTFNGVVLSEGVDKSFCAAGQPMQYRPIKKREFGETIVAPEGVERFDSGEWKPLPLPPQELWRDF